METMTIKQNGMSTSNNVNMSGMPHHTTHFLPLSLNHMRLMVILCGYCWMWDIVWHSKPGQGKRCILKQRQWQSGISSNHVDIAKITGKTFKPIIECRVSHWCWLVQWLLNSLKFKPRISIQWFYTSSCSLCNKYIQNGELRLNFPEIRVLNLVSFRSLPFILFHHIF